MQWEDGLKTILKVVLVQEDEIRSLKERVAKAEAKDLALARTFQALSTVLDHAGCLPPGRLASEMDGAIRSANRNGVSDDVVDFLKVIQEQFEASRHAGLLN